MTPFTPAHESFGPEETANTVSHGLGLVAAIAVTPPLILVAIARGSAADIVGSSVFGASLILAYLASTLFHASRRSDRRAVLQRVDHAAIYVLIAGTYTPFTLGVLRGGGGWTLFGLVWGVAAIGVATKLAAGVRYPRISTAAYLVMGWLIIIALGPLVERMEPAGLRWLVAGGVCYTVGVVFYVASRFRFGHLLWHLFVLAGSACHVVAVLGYATSG